MTTIGRDSFAQNFEVEVKFFIHQVLLFPSTNVFFLYFVKFPKNVLKYYSIFQ